MKHIITLLALCVSLSLSAQPLKKVSPEDVGMDSKQLQYVDDAIESAILEGCIPGAVLAVVRGGAMPYLKAYGNRSLTPRTERMSDDTIFDIASCTKSVVTAIATMKLVEQGRIALWDSVDRYIPGFNDSKEVDSVSRTVRISHLLTHTSGISPYISVGWLKREYDGVVTRDSLMDYLVRRNINTVPGEKFKYSCLNFILLQYIIEDITGKSLQEFAKENIFEPLGMTSTDYIPLDTLGMPLKMRRSKSREFNANKIAPTEVIEENTAIRGVVHDPLAREINLGVSGNAGVFSTASDLAILMATLLNNGVYNDTRILSPLTMDAMRSIKSQGRALGWDVSSPYSLNKGDLLSSDSFGHTGFTGTSIVIDKENDVAIILLTNAIHSEEYDAKEMIHLRSAVANVVAASITNESPK